MRPTFAPAAKRRIRGIPGAVRGRRAAGFRAFFRLQPASQVTTSHLTPCKHATYVSGCARPTRSRPRNPPIRCPLRAGFVGCDAHYRAPDRAALAAWPVPGTARNEQADALPAPAHRPVDVDGDPVAVVVRQIDELHERPLEALLSRGGHAVVGEGEVEVGQTAQAVRLPRPFEENDLRQGAGTR